MTGKPLAQEAIRKRNRPRATGERRAEGGLRREGTRGRQSSTHIFGEEGLLFLRVLGLLGLLHLQALNEGRSLGTRGGQRREAMGPGSANKDTARAAAGWLSGYYGGCCPRPCPAPASWSTRTPRALTLGRWPVAAAAQTC